MSACLNLCLKLDHLFLLIGQECLPLVLSILVSELLDPDPFLDFQVSELLPVVHGLLNSLINSYKLLVVLILLQLGRGLDLGGLDGTVKLLVELLHLKFMLHLELLNLDETVVLEVGEVLLPLVIEVLQLRVTDFDIFCQLALLDVSS